MCRDVVLSLSLHCCVLCVCVLVCVLREKREMKTKCMNVEEEKRSSRDRGGEVETKYMMFGLLKIYGCFWEKRFWKSTLLCILTKLNCNNHGD